MKRKLDNIKTLEEAVDYINALRRKNACKNTQICVLRAQVKILQNDLSRLVKNLVQSDEKVVELAGQLREAEKLQEAECKPRGLFAAIREAFSL